MSYRNEGLKLALAIMAQNPGLPSNERLSNLAREAREQAELIGPGLLQDTLLERAREFEAQIAINRVFRV